MPGQILQDRANSLEWIDQKETENPLPLSIRISFCPAVADGQQIVYHTAEGESTLDL